MVILLRRYYYCMMKGILARPRIQPSGLQNQKRTFFVIKIIVVIIHFTVLCNCGNASKKAIYIAGLFPVSEGIPEGAMGRGVLPAVQLALDHVNNHTGLLDDYHLEIIWNNTEVSAPFLRLCDSLACVRAGREVITRRYSCYRSCLRGLGYSTDVCTVWAMFDV